MRLNALLMWSDTSWLDGTSDLKYILCLSFSNTCQLTICIDLEKGSQEAIQSNTGRDIPMQMAV